MKGAAILNNMHAPSNKTTDWQMMPSLLSKIESAPLKRVTFEIKIGSNRKPFSILLVKRKPRQTIKLSFVDFPSYII